MVASSQRQFNLSFYDAVCLWVFFSRGEQFLWIPSEFCHWCAEGERRTEGWGERGGMSSPRPRRVMESGSKRGESERVHSDWEFICCFSGPVILQEAQERRVEGERWTLWCGLTCLMIEAGEKEWGEEHYESQWWGIGEGVQRVGKREERDEKRRRTALDCRAAVDAAVW